MLTLGITRHRLKPQLACEAVNPFVQPARIAQMESCTLALVVDLAPWPVLHCLLALVNAPLATTVRQTQRHRMRLCVGLLQCTARLAPQRLVLYHQACIPLAA